MEVDVPHEVVVDYDNEFYVSVESDHGVSEHEVSLPDVDVSRWYVENESSSRSSVFYRPRELGGKDLKFEVEVVFEDGETVTHEEEVFLDHRNVVGPRVWDGVAMPIPDDLEEDVHEVASREYGLNDSVNLFWGPTTADGTMYILATHREVEYGGFSMIGSLATYAEDRHFEIAEDVYLCFYHANYLTFFDREDVVLPSDEEIEHGDAVAIDASFDRVDEMAYRYNGEAVEEDVVFVDHSGVLGDGVEGDYVRGSVVDVPFTRMYYLQHMGLEADIYVYPTEVLAADEVPKVVDGDRVVSGEGDVEVLRNWVESDRTRVPTVDDPRRGTVEVDDGAGVGDRVDSEEPGVDEADEHEGDDVDYDDGEVDDVEADDEPLPLGYAALAAALTSLFLTRALGCSSGSQD